MESSNQSSPDIEGLSLHVPGLSNDPARWRDVIFNNIPLLKYFRVEEMDKPTLARAASSLYLLGLQHGQDWLMNLPFELNSRAAVDLFRDYVAPDRVSIFYMKFFSRYPSFKGLSVRGLLVHLSRIEEAVKQQRYLEDSGYLPHNERMIVHLYVSLASDEHPIVTIDPESEYYEYIVGRLRHRGVFHLTDEVDGKLYTVMTHYRDRVLKISGRVRTKPEQ